MDAPQHQPLTREDLKEVIRAEVPKIIAAEVPKIIATEVPKIIRAEVPKIIEEIVPGMLGAFAEEVLLPAVQRIVRSEIGESEHRLKTWVDERLADLRADITLLTRKEDRKVLRLVDMLRTKHIISDGEAADLLRMEPFAQL